MRIAIYAISKNEEKHVKRFLDAGKLADVIVIADTGSTDNTIVEVAHWAHNNFKTSVYFHNIHISPWRFDDARNASLALVPPDVDVCMCLDLDEVLQEGWRAEIERTWVPGKTTRLHYMFDWSGAGNPFIYEKIHARHGYRWKHPCHERPYTYGISEFISRCNDAFTMVVHKADSSKPRPYLDLLKLSVEEDPKDGRNAFYYARELSFYGDPQEAIKECERYLALPDSNWAAERCYARRTMGRMYDKLGQPENASRAFHAAAVELPDSREPWFELAALMYREGDWPNCLHFAQKCLAVADREKVYTVDPECWGHLPYLYASLGAFRTGQFAMAQAYGLQALAIAPDDAMLKANQAFFDEAVQCSANGDLGKTPSVSQT